MEEIQNGKVEANLGGSLYKKRIATKGRGKSGSVRTLLAYSDRLLTLKQALPYVLLIGGVIGVLCAGILTVEKIQLLKDPETHLSCDINPIVACGAVINTDQASAFGFPNPINRTSRVRGCGDNKCCSTGRSCV